MFKFKCFYRRAPDHVDRACYSDFLPTHPPYPNLTPPPLPTPLRAQVRRQAGDVARSASGLLASVQTRAQALALRLVKSQTLMAELEEVGGVWVCVGVGGGDVCVWCVCGGVCQGCCLSPC